MLDPKTVARWLEPLIERIPCKTHEDIKRFIADRPEAKFVRPAPELTVDDHWFSYRRYHDAVTHEDILEIYIGNRESGAEYLGYDRIDPRWHDAEGRDMKRWEITRAYMRPKYRGRNYSLFMVELVLGLARKNRAYSVVAYPRHVAMLITLLNYGFRTMEGNYDHTLLRILKQARRWYGNNATQRRLYFAQELRPFIQDGSFVMEKKLQKTTLWSYLMERV
jgi:GNAT superfamily N-acetyltransferase